MANNIQSLPLLLRYLAPVEDAGAGAVCLLCLLQPRLTGLHRGAGHPVPLGCLLPAPVAVIT